LTETQKEQNRQTDRRRKTRMKAAKLGLEVIPLLREHRPHRPRATTPEEKAGYKADYKVRNLVSSAEYRRKNPEKRRATCLAWDSANRARKSAVETIRRSRPEVRERNRQRKRQRLRDDIQYRLRECLRATLWAALRRGRKFTIRKAAPTMKLIGCSITDLMVHLEGNFEVGMSWKNYGQWHVDHVIPLSNFDLTDPAQQFAAANWKNLQPLWAVDNISKGNRLDWVKSSGAI